MSRRRPRVRTWRRHLGRPCPRARAHPAAFPDSRRASPGPDAAPTGIDTASDVRERPTTSGTGSGPAERPGLLGSGPHAVGWALDTGPLTPPRLLRPQQGRLGDCWVIAAMLAVHDVAPQHLARLLSVEDGGVVAVHLPALPHPIRVDRTMPVDGGGRFLGARREDANPGWAGVLEKAIALHVAGGYGALQRGFARFGLEILTGRAVTTHLRSPSAAQILAWRAAGCALTASTHPLSRLVRTAHGALPPNHVFAIVGADARSGHVLLRNPHRPGRLLTIDARTFRRGFLAVDVTEPLVGARRVERHPPDPARPMLRGAPGRPG